MRVVRVLIYDGTEKFVKACLKPDRAVAGIYKVPEGTIREMFVGKDPSVAKMGFFEGLFIRRIVRKAGF